MGREIKVVLSFILIPTLLFGQEGLNSKGIRIKQFSVTKTNDYRLKIKISSEGFGGVQVGSYSIAVEGFNGDNEIKKLPSLKLSGRSLYVISKDFSSNEDVLLKDNGQLDEDKRIGHFAYTLDAKSWPDARYHIKIFATNRPAKGTYYAGTDIYGFDKGNIHSSKSDLAVENKVVWKKKNVHAYFPSLFKLDDGRLVTRFATRLNPSHIDTAGGMKTLISANNGKTWHEPKNYFSIPAPKTKDGKFISLRVGGWNYESKAALRSPNKVKDLILREAGDDRVAYLSTEAIARVSKDGKNWTEKEIKIPNEIAGLIQFSTLTTNNGVYLLGLYGYRKDRKENSEVFFIRSGDNGETWEFIYLTPNGMEPPNLNPSETSLTELPNGDILVMMRTEQTIYSSISKDAGKTWSKPIDTGIRGFPPFVLSMPDGRLLCLYGYRQNPMGIRGVISYDNGKSWDIKNELVIRDDGKAVDPGNLGYPKAALLPDDRIFVIYYFTTDGHTPFIASSTFRIPSIK